MYSDVVGLYLNRKKY